jgi:hypothetical protein
MAYQILERPYKFSFAGNPVRYVFNITNPLTPGCALEVELRSIPIWQNLGIGDFGELLSAQTLYPNPDGKVFFYCEDLLNSFLEWELPSLQYNQVNAIDKQIRKFYVRYRQVTTDSPSPVWASDSDHMLVVLKGGVAKEKFDRNNFFLNHMPQKKPFLTWMPADHFIGPEEQRYLTYLHFTDDTADLFLKARVVYTDGVQQTATLPFPLLTVSRLFRLPAGLVQLGLAAANPDKMIWYYDVSVEDGAGNVFATPYRLYVDYNQYYGVFSFVYANSIGGFDTVRIRGDYDVEVTRDFTDIEQAIGEYKGEVLPTENNAVNISKYETYKGDVGLLDTKQQQDSLQELLLSDHVFRLVAGRWLRVANLQKTQNMGSSNDTLWNFPLQWRYTFDNGHYTPEGIEFGVGTSDDIAGPLYGTCTAPSGLTVAYIGPDGIGKKYRFSWENVADAMGYELYWTQFGFWTKVAAATNSVDITFTETGDYSWKVRTQCGTDDFSGYAFGPGFHSDIDAPLCAAPDNLAVTLLTIDGSSSDLRLSWSPVAGVVGYVVQIREVGGFFWTSFFLTLDNLKVTVGKDVQAEWRVRSKCDFDDHYSGYTYGDNFIPSNLIGSCAVPSALSVVITEDPKDAILGPGPYKIAQFNWTNSGGGTLYDLQYREKGTTTWTVKTGVQSGALYSVLKLKTFEWRMRTQCTGGGYSDFINGPDFNT